MKILIAQPIHEGGILQLRKDIENNEDVDLVIYPEGYICDEILLEDTCKLAKFHNTMIITSYKKDFKDRALIIDKDGNKILERWKTPAEFKCELYEPLVVETNKLCIGYLLCMEILKGYRDLEKANRKIDFIVHPIGVGMFSNEQFNLWINEAKRIAKKYNTMIIGTSHADGSYRNCGISIPISYCIDKSGEEIYISKSDTRTRIIDLNTKTIIERG